MNRFSFNIARRYLFSKKSHNAINIISAISVCGIAVATMALVCTLSVFNGFEDLAKVMYGAFDPDLRIEVAKGKVFDRTDTAVRKALAQSGVGEVVEVLEEDALLKYGDGQAPVSVKGVSDNFVKTTDVSKLMIQGDFDLRLGDVDYAVLGVGLASNLNAHKEFAVPLELFAPIRNAKVNLANPASAFTQTYLFLNGVLSVNDAKLDDNLVIVSIDVARKVFGYDSTQVSALQVQVKNGASVSDVKNRLRTVLGSDYRVKDRLEQQASVFKMMEIEKWVTFFILAFIAVIAVFNVMGSLTMLIIEKENDISVLKSLGATNSLVASIFRTEGCLITILGACIGVVLGVVLCLVQQYFGLLKLGDGSQTFFIDSYPVRVQIVDILVVLLSVSAIGILAVSYPVRNLKKRLSAQ